MSDNGKSLTKPTENVSHEFTKVFVESLCVASAEAAVEFGPSLCNSVYGLGDALWTSAQHPVESTQNLANCFRAMCNCMENYCRTLDWNTVEGYVDEVKNLYDRFDQLNETEKGALIGHAIGKYGFEILAGSAVFKGIALFRNMKNANTMCNLEAMALSNANKEVITLSALRHTSQREIHLKNVRINWPKQNKHIPGKHNFIPGRRTITLEASEFEILVKEHAGTGQPRLCTKDDSLVGARQPPNNLLILSAS